MDASNLTKDWKPRFRVAFHDTTRNEPLTEEQLDQAYSCNYDLLTTFITNNHFHTRVNELISNHLSGKIVPTVSHLTYLDTHLEPGSVADYVLAFTSPWIDICSPDPMVAGISKQILFMEVAYAAFCGFKHIIIQGPKLSHRDTLRNKDVETNNVMPFARAIQECLSIAPNLQISVRVPFSDDPAVKVKDLGHLTTRLEYIEPDLNPTTHSADLLASWETWHTIRTTCRYHARLGVAVDIPAHLHAAYLRSRWYSEPLKALFLDEASFSLNSLAYPVLHSTVCKFLRDIMRLKLAPYVFLEDVGDVPAPNSSGEMQVADGYLPDEAVSPATRGNISSRPQTEGPQDDLAYLNYVRYVENQQDQFSEIEQYMVAYQDYAQIPLQPLTDNLESMTYEVFEKDPVKYRLYEEAVRKALRDWKDQGKSSSGPDGKVVVVVAGAGRGPLVTAALKASRAENVPIDMWAVEKNPNAFVLLQRRNREKWKRQVTIEHSDMRSWKGPWQTNVSPTPAEAASYATDPPEVAPEKVYYPVDILISELLGSFGDNELSPECLDGILHLLSKPHGISIPRSYTAWLTPISAPKLHADTSHRTSWDPTAQETPAVVWFHQIDYLSREAKYSESNGQEPNRSSSLNEHPQIAQPSVQQAWEFVHDPNNVSGSAEDSTHINKGSLGGSNMHNTRFAKLTFRNRYRGVCHGLGGYFESVLYPGVELSTNPNTIDAKSKDMISWFPIFFPLKTPLYIPGTSTLDVSIWRQTDGRKVWYEWLVESFGWSLHRGNFGSLNGRGSSEAEQKGKAEKAERRMVKLGTTELHSSIKNGCLM